MSDQIVDVLALAPSVREASFFSEDAWNGGRQKKYHDHCGDHVMNAAENGVGKKGINKARYSFVE